MANHQNALENRKPQIMAWMVAGLSNAQIARILEEGDRRQAIHVSRQAVQARRRAWAQELRPLCLKASETAIEAAISQKAERLRLYQRAAEILVVALEDVSGHKRRLGNDEVRQITMLVGGGLTRVLHNVAEEQGELYRRAELIPVGNDRDGGSDTPLTSEATIERVIVRRYIGFDPNDIG